MLDLMRAANRRKWFVWTVILFVVFSFVGAIFAIWGGAATGQSLITTNVWMARVDGREITASEVDRQQRFVESQYRQFLGDQFDQQAANFNFPRVALNQLLSQSLAYGEAARLGLQPSADEVAETIVNAPVFRRNGQFIGREQYLNELRGRGYDVTEYEQEVERQIAVDRLRELVGTMVAISDAELENAWKDEGETAEVDYVMVRESDFISPGDPSVREIEAWYRDHRSTFMTAEKRRASYVLIDRDPLVKSVDVPDADISDYYEKNKETMYRSPEQWRASHILIKTEAGTDETAMRARTQQVLEKLRAGGDFAQLARENSEDSSAAEGGDLGWFGRGRMVPEFEQATWALSQGSVSDLVRTQFGFHIIKLTGQRPAGVTPLEEVRDQIRQQLGFGKAQELLLKKAEEFKSKLDSQSSSMESLAGELGYTMKDTGLVAKTEELGELGHAPQAADEIFRMKQGDVSGPINIGRGIVFARVVEVKQPEPAPLDSVKDKVKDDLVKSRAREKARGAAAEIVAAGAEGFKAAADKKKLEVKSTGEFTRATAPADFNDGVKKSIFSHKANDLLGPLDGADAILVVKMIKRGPQTAEEITQRKAQLRTQLAQRRREDAFGALLQRVQRNAVIDENETALEELNRRTR